MDDITVSTDLIKSKEVEVEKDNIREYNTLYCEHEKKDKYTSIKKK